ncbi:hypothetical protein ABW20_dc0105167 [Dactylellina cionopaga]|nr:hypothetical protein ABW20_dc0105167 [Dactylellina cionopaga]
MGDFQGFLGPCLGTLEHINFVDCIFDRGKEEWFGLLKYLKQNSTSLLSFEILLHFYEKSDPYYAILFNLHAQGSMSLESTICFVEVEPIDDLGVTLSKYIAKELDSHELGDSEGFWESITDGIWKDKELIQRNTNTIMVQTPV